MPVALVAASVLLLNTGCAARFARSDGNGGDTALSQGGLPAEQAGGTTGASAAPGGNAPRTGTTGVTAPRSGTTGTTVSRSGGTTGGGTTGGAGSTSGATSGGTSTGGATTGTVGRGAALGGCGAGAGTVAPGNQTGVTDTAVKIGLFLPKTGAAPVPPTIDAQAQNYWDYVKSLGGIYGRNVTITIYDTGSTEAGARSAVQQAQSDGIFAAVSLDRISVEGALVTALHKAGIPHLINQMPHDQEIPSDGFYVGTDQVNNARQIAHYMKNTLKKTKVGFIGETDPTAYPARDAFVAEAKKIGLQVVHNEVVDGMGNQFLAEAQKVANDKPESVWMYVAPNNAINISKEVQADGFHPVWVSSSIAWGFNLVLTPSSGALDGAKAFSPWGGLSDPRYATFNKVNTAGRTTQDKDIGLGAWGFGQIVAAAMHDAGKTLGRANFTAAMQNLCTGKTDVVTKTPMCWPPLDFTGGKRYGSGDRTIVMTVKGSGASGNSVWATESDYSSVY
jgi:ABC-type branched-subunit amino acid transport system substrate-binding protein